MSKIRCLLTILLALAVLILIGINLSDRDDVKLDMMNIDVPTYTSDRSDTMVYSPEGLLHYRLIAQHVEYFSDERAAWFTQPEITTFDTYQVPMWSIKSDRAKLKNDRILCLYGHVEVNALIAESQLRKITTNNAEINLVTQDMMSQDLVVLYGAAFNSSGLRMRGNLRSKNASLIEQVKTSYFYETKNK